MNKNLHFRNSLNMLWALSIIILTVLVVTGCEKKEVAKQSELKVGLVLPMTGDAAQYGVAMNRGAQLAVEEYNAKNPSIPIDIILEDSQGTAKLGVTVTEKLIQQDHVPVIISAFSGVILATAPIAERNKVVMINGPANSPKLRGLSPYLFNMMLLSDQEGSYLADVAYKRLDKRNVAVFYTDNDSGRGFYQVFAKRFKELGGNIVIAEGHKQNESNFRTVLFKAKKVNPDLIFLAAYYKEAALLIKQAREIGITVPFLSYSAIESPEFLKLAGHAAEGVVYSQPGFDTTSDSPIMKSFISQYKKKYNEDPNIWAAQFYDAIQVITSAINTLKGRELSGENIRKAIAEMKPLEGVVGSIEFDEQGSLKRDLRLKTVKDGKFTKYEG